jgi:hypothetical protein
MAPYPTNRSIKLIDAPALLGIMQTSIDERLHVEALRAGFAVSAA